jgi:hypothetical protein
MFGFELVFWDCATFVIMFTCVLLGLTFIVWFAGLPGRIAIARKHPDAEAIKIMGYAGLLVAVPWVQAFIWAFKPTDVVDIRRFPREEAKDIQEDLDRLAGKTSAPTQPNDSESASSSQSTTAGDQSG